MDLVLNPMHPAALDHRAPGLRVDPVLNPMQPRPPALPVLLSFQELVGTLELDLPHSPNTGPAPLPCLC